MKSKNKHWYYHFAVVAVVIAMDFLGEFFYGGRNAFLRNFELPINFGQIIIYIATFTTYAVNFFIVCPQTLRKKRYFQFVIGVVICIMIFAAVRYLGEEVILYHFTGKHNYFEVSRTVVFYTFDNSYLAIKGILYSTLLFIFFEHNNNQSRLHRLELDYKNAELSFLKSQLEPHFLFNTLNTFYTDLVDVQPKIAKDIHRLSELLRYITYEANQEMMPLHKEIKFIEDYIYLHRKRFEDTLFLIYKIDGNIGQQIVPSLVFIHFVENIFKHGLINQKDNPAKLMITINENTIIVETYNKISGSEKYSNIGIGKENLERRLSAIYKDNFQLDYLKTEDTFTAKLKLPVKSII